MQIDNLVGNWSAILMSITKWDNIEVELRETIQSVTKQ